MKEIYTDITLKDEKTLNKVIHRIQEKLNANKFSIEEKIKITLEELLKEATEDKGSL